jgi:hypothetical protein
MKIRLSKTRRIVKPDNTVRPKPEHLKWLVESRRQNQEVSAHLYELMTPECWKSSKFGYDAKTLVSIGFSLWRAAFLADKSGQLKETNAHTIYFLGEMLETNAIAFTQDKKAKGFTFNYYLANVRFRLAEYKIDHPSFNVDARLLKKGKLKNLSPTDRWRAFQKAFSDAVSHFEQRFKKFKRK